MEKLRIAVIGCGRRATGLTQVIVTMADVQIVALCDPYKDKAEKLADFVEEKSGRKPYIATCHKDVIENVTIDAAIVATSWSGHMPVTIDFMRAGVPVGFEVGGCDSVEECWQLVHAYQETNVAGMMLENCCYARKELMLLNMVRQGFFGEIAHIDGAYCHDLRNEVARGKEERTYRLANYLNKNCENYPTHELGPIAKMLNLNRGNRMISLTSTASKSVGMKGFFETYRPNDEEMKKMEWAQGDVITTVIKCAHGETITLTLDTTLPRFYSRNLNVHGTKAFYHNDTNSVFEDSKFELDDESLEWKNYWNNFESYQDKFEHPIWKEYLEAGVIAGHGGMDALVLRAFFEAVKAGVKPPIDIYDAVSWMAISPLSEISIATGSAPVAIPDFTEGKWFTREPIVEGKYCLDKVCVDTSIPIIPSAEVKEI